MQAQILLWKVRKQIFKLFFLKLFFILLFNNLLKGDDMLQAYDLNKSTLHAAGATKISDANPKSELDWIILRASQTPSSQDYGIPELPRKEGVRFSSVNYAEIRKCLIHTNVIYPLAY